MDDFSAYAYSLGQKAPKYWSSNFNKGGQQYWNNELQKMLGIQTGRIQPTDLPEYKSMADQYTAQSSKGLADVIQQLSQRGITGGAAGSVISGAEDKDRQNLLQMIQTIIGSASQRGATAANTALTDQQFWNNLNLGYNKLGQEWWQTVMNKRAAEKQGGGGGLLDSIIGAVGSIIGAIV